MEDKTVKKKTSLLKRLVLAALAAVMAFSLVGCSAQRVGSILPVSLVYRYVQGGCSDGQYIYVALNDGKKADSKSVIIKCNPSNMRVVATYKNLKFGHGNDLCFNTSTNELIVVNSSPDGRLLNIYDASNMSLKEVVTLSKSVHGLTYDADQDCYYGAVSGATQFVKLDADFNIVETYAMQPCDDTKQNLDLIGDYLCFLRYDDNLIEVYTKDGEFVKNVDVPLDAYEPEFVCHIGDTVYIGCNLLTYTGGCVYKMDISSIGMKTLAQYGIDAEDLEALD